MKLFCTERFKSEFFRLKNKKPYSNLEEEIINQFIDKHVSDLLSGTRLNGSDPNPFIKKRLDGSGGYRVYYLLITFAGDVYLMFVHPKTGPEGSENITDEGKKEIYKEVLEAIKSGNVFSVTYNAKDNGLLFNP